MRLKQKVLDASSAGEASGFQKQYDNLADLYETFLNQFSQKVSKVNQLYGGSNSNWYMRRKLISFCVTV